LLFVLLLFDFLCEIVTDFVILVMNVVFDLS
jgi:hypothetical protein